MDTKEPQRDPLPRRFERVREIRNLLRKGIVVLPDNLTEHYDAANAAQSIIIDHLLTEVMESWKTPELIFDDEIGFYKLFGITYLGEVIAREQTAWQALLDSTLSSHDLDLNNLRPLEAATLTLANFPGHHETAASSWELFYEISMHAQVYEKLLQEKYGKTFHDTYYEGLRTSFSNYVKRLITLDSVIVDLYRSNLNEVKSLASEAGEYGPLSTQYFTLGDNDEFTVQPHVLNLLKQYALENKLTKDSLGREENRGCPFMVSVTRDTFISFAIEEYITQHKLYFTD